MWSAKLKIFTLQALTENVCQALVYRINSNFLVLASPRPPK